MQLVEKEHGQLQLLDTHGRPDANTHHHDRDSAQERLVEFLGAWTSYRRSKDESECAFARRASVVEPAQAPVSEAVFTLWHLPSSPESLEDADLEAQSLRP